VDVTARKWGQRGDPAETITLQGRPLFRYNGCRRRFGRAAGQETGPAAAIGRLNGRTILRAGERHLKAVGRGADQPRDRRPAGPQSGNGQVVQQAALRPARRGQSQSGRGPGPGDGDARRPRPRPGRITCARLYAAAGPAQLLHRPPARTGRGHRPAQRGPAGDHHRTGRLRQDPAGPAVGRGGRRPLCPRRHLRRPGRH
jgi:hypothetical protein